MGGADTGGGVEVGCGAAILGQVTIGDGARIGPNAVVMTNVPAGATVFAPSPRIIYPRGAEFSAPASIDRPGNGSPEQLGHDN